jgi:hypothetical protein
MTIWHLGGFFLKIIINTLIRLRHFHVGEQLLTTALRVTGTLYLYSETCFVSTKCNLSRTR